MGKWQTAARAARLGNRPRKTHHSKINNKQRQRTPKRVRKQMNRSKLRREEEMELIAARKNKRLQQLSFQNLTTQIKDELSGAYKTKKSKKQMSRSQRNKFSRENKKIQKLEERQKKQEALFDFSSYKRDIDQDTSSEEEDSDTESEQSEEEKMLQQFERRHTASSYDTRKVLLSLQ